MKRERISPCIFAVVLLLAIAVPPPSAAQMTESLTATATCSLTGNRYDDARFVLSTPAEVNVSYDGVDGNWWIAQEPAGPVLISVQDGELLYALGVAVSGDARAGWEFTLPAGSFLMHADCTALGASGSATVRLPAAPAPPPGPQYLAIARASAGPSGSDGDWAHGYNDRVFTLVARQLVALSGPSSEGSSTGYIIDIDNTRWWSMTGGTLGSGSTLDLPPGTYCLHVDYPKGTTAQFSDQWALRFVGPTQPRGDKTSVRGQYNPSPTEDAPKYEEVAFVLTAPQVVGLRPESGNATYWIVDATGTRWYDEINGVTQSCSAWVLPSGTQPGRPKAEPEGLLLPAGTYLLHVDAGGTGAGRYGVSVDFIGSRSEPFAWPEAVRCPCGRRSPLGTGGSLLDRLLGLPQGIKDVIEKRIQRVIEEIVDEMFDDLLGPECQSAIFLPALGLLGVCLSVSRRRRDRRR